MSVTGSVQKSLAEIFRGILQFFNTEYSIEILQSTTIKIVLKIYAMFLLTFMYEITLTWVCLRGMNIIVFFLWIYSGKSVAVLF